MDLGLKGKAALVAASSQGIGYAAALALAAEGARVAVCSRRKEAIEAAARRMEEHTGQPVAGFQADVSRPDEVERLVGGAAKALGGLDILVTNAGGPPRGVFEDFDDAQWSAAVNLNLMSTIRLIRCALPYLKQSAAGRIVNVASVSIKEPIDGLILSNTVRAGVMGLAKTLSRELAPFGITVNTVCPGYILTERLRSFLRGAAEERGVPEEDVLEAAQSEVPLGRLGRPEEMGDLITFLASERAAYITGTTIAVDGGLTRGI